MEIVFFDVKIVRSFYVKVMSNKKSRIVKLINLADLERLEIITLSS